MTDQFYRNELVSLDRVAVGHRVIPKLINEGNFAWAGVNYRLIAESYADLGLLHWRRGWDPRPHFELGVAAYEKLHALVQDHHLNRRDYECSVVYAMLSLMGHRVSIEFDDEKAHRDFRLPCCECCIVHALHDQPLNDVHALFLEHYLTAYDDVPQKTYITYLQLLGLRPTSLSQNDLVRAAEQNWLDHKTNKSFSEGLSLYGHGVMNEI